MTDAHIQRILIDAFLTLNVSSGKPYITFVDGKPTNVAMPNIAFIPSASKQFFVLSHLPGEPNPAGMGTEAFNRFDGVFQIDVYSPLGKGEDEINAKYEALSKLFERGRYFDDVLINKIYCPHKETMEGVYRAVIRVNWTANLPK
jgi:hypothetical protein